MPGCSDCIYCTEKRNKNIPSKESCQCYGKIRALSIYDIADDIKRGKCRFRKAETISEKESVAFQL